MPRALPAVALLALTLAACGAKEPPPGCPQVGLVNQLDHMTAFRPGGSTDLTDVTYDAQIVDFAAVCDFQSKGVAVTTSFQIVATRGPADTQRNAPLQFFVAISDPSGEIVTKEVFDAPIPFEGNLRRVGRREEMEPFIPYPADKTRLPLYTVLYGFQLTQEQADYNKRTKRPESIKSLQPK
jgi:hypothetical protein